MDNPNGVLETFKEGKPEIFEISSFADPQEIWSSLMEKAEDSWTWHHYGLHTYRRRLCELVGESALDLSFVIAWNGNPVALAPVLLREVKLGDFVGKELGYRNWPLPWPCFVKGDYELNAMEDVVFDHLEALARMHGAGRLSVILSPAMPRGDEESRFARIARERRFIDLSYPSHNIILSQNTLSEVRKRYRRYVRHFGPHYDVRIVEGNAVDDEIEEAYFQLHVKDAGGQFRPRESYCFQADLARTGESFYVVATNKAAGKVVGMLMVEFVKGAAYDGSVAVDPDYQHEYVSHIMKWHAIETLLERNAMSYELGIKAVAPNETWQPSEKNYGISYFKEGWSRGCEKKVLVAEKYYSGEFLEAFYRQRAKDLAAYFQV